MSPPGHSLECLCIAIQALSTTLRASGLCLFHSQRSELPKVAPSSGVSRKLPHSDLFYESPPCGLTEDSLLRRLDHPEGQPHLHYVLYQAPARSRRERKFLLGLSVS